MLLNYEGIRYMSDKQIIVLEMGSAYTKYGFVGENAPRAIIKSEVKCPNLIDTRKIFDYKDDDDLYQLLVDFLHTLFFTHAEISPKELKIVIVESPLILTRFRNILAKVLFKHFEVGMLMILPAHLVTISTLGVETALVLDVGYEEASLIPIFEGVPILKAWQALPLAGKAINERIAKDMKNILKEDELTEYLIENIKVQTCFVTNMERSSKLDTDDPPHPPPDVKFYSTRNFEIPGFVRERAYEMLWERDQDNLCIPSMVLDALAKCPIDTRRPLAENILLVGGTVMAKGFTSRLKAELMQMAKTETFMNKIKFSTFKFHEAPCKPNCTIWLGGAIFGVADLPSRCVTKESYLANSRVPEWTNLLDNKKEENINNK